ncbi:MAG: sulfotransferase domain-containing protein [Myxococcota bacterium]
MAKPEDRVQWIIKKLFPRSFDIKKRAMTAWKFGTADAVVVSYPKSGRTWLRATLTFYFAERYGLEDPPLLEFANLHYLDARIPKIFFTHDDDPNARPEALEHDKSAYHKKRVLYLARDPRDVCVSMYFHRTKRDLDIDVPIFDFANGPDGGLRTTIAFMNIWAEALPKVPESLVISYEAMHADPEQTLADALRFLGQEPDLDCVKAALERSRFDRLQSMEKKGEFESGRLTAADTEDKDSFKVRRGKVGGYTDYFDDAQQATLNEVATKQLSSYFDPFLRR